MVKNEKPGLLSRIFGRRALAEDAPLQNEETRTIVLHPRPLGSSGTESYAGYSNEEYLQKLRHTQRADIFDQMRRSDPQVKMCLAAVKNPIKDANWEIEAYDDSPEAIRAKELVEHILFKDMDDPWDEFLGEALSMVDFGHSVFEVTHKVVMGHPKFGTYNGIRSLGWRSPRTIEKWNLDRETGKLVSVTQYAYGDLDRMVEIPATFLLVFTLDKEGSNYEGISWLRPCYGPWFRKNEYLKINAIGVERFAVPTAIGKYPAGAQNTEAKAAFEQALQYYTSHQANYLTIPSGYEVELKSNAYDPEKTEVSIDNEDKRMTKAFLANFLELGMGTVGSFALSNDLSDFFLSGINHVAKEISSRINQRLIPDLVLMNLGPNFPPPKLKASGISDKAGKELADILKILGDGKWLTPSDKDEEHLRRRLDLPEMSLEGARDTAPAPASGMASLPAPAEVTLSERIRRASRKT